MIRQVNPALPQDYRPQLPAHAYAPATIVVEDAPYNGDLQAAINAAGPGDIVELLAGKSYEGTLTIGASTKGTPGNEIVIRSSGWHLPPVAWKNRAKSTVNMATVKGVGTGNDGRVLNISASTNGTGGAAHIWILGIHFTNDEPTELVNTLIYVGSNSTTNPADQCSHITFDRCIIRGNETGEVGFGLRLNGAYTALLNSTLEEVHNPNVLADGGSGLHMHNYTGPVLIENNYISASGIALMTGGTQNPQNDLMHPADVTIRHNHVAKNPAWQGGVPYWTCKNLIESKFTRRLLVEDNIVEYTWADIPNGQIGHALNMKTSNQTPGDKRFLETTDLTVRWNVIRHCQVAWTMNGAGTSNVPGQPTHRMKFVNNLCYDLSSAWNRSSEGGTDNSNAINMGANHGAKHHQIVHNTFVCDGTDWSPAFSFRKDQAGKEDTPPWWLDELVIRDNIFDGGTGPNGTGTVEGTACLDNFGRRYDCRHNIWMGRNPADYGASSQVDSVMEGNQFPANSGAIGYEDAANDDYRLRPDSPYAGAATDGTDIGCDVVQVLQRTQHVISGLRG